MTRVRASRPAGNSPRSGMNRRGYTSGTSGPALVRYTDRKGQEPRIALRQYRDLTERLLNV
ncbi:hypothetical protein AB0I52_26705 [Streptomyces sp. NPDC050423]|uniref:hypothetical protein n=1 Tax=Streptomyces sp. NPDC050423 TaxID=3155402 RepID=UPI00343F724D